MSSQYNTQQQHNTCQYLYLTTLWCIGWYICISKNKNRSIYYDILRTYSVSNYAVVYWVVHLYIKKTKIDQFTTIYYVPILYLTTLWCLGRISKHTRSTSLKYKCFLIYYESGFIDRNVYILHVFYCVFERRGFAPVFVNYKKGALDSQPQVIKFTSLPVVAGSLRVFRLLPPLKLVAMIQLKYC